MFDAKFESPTTTAGQNPPAESHAGPLAWFGLVILIVVAFFAFVDRQILIVLTEPIRHEFGLTDTEIGLLQGAGIALFAGIAALPIGWVADRVDRRVVLAACVLVWSAATAACGLTNNFWHLFLATVGLGIGEAGLIPVIYGMIPDLFGPRQRVLANAIFALANLLGTGAGMALGGALMHGIAAMHGSLPVPLSEFAPWRLAFFAVALPAPVLILLIALIRSGHKGGSNHTASPHKAARSMLSASMYFRREAPMMLKFFGAIGLVNLAFVGVATWMPVVAVRTFGATPADAGSGMGLAAMAGGIVGCVMGGLVARRTRARFGVLAPLRVCEFGALVAGALSFAYLVADSVTAVYTLFGVQLACMVAGLVLFPTIMQEICPPYLRSRVAAIGVLTSVVVQAAAPVFIGFTSDRLITLHQGLLWSIVGVAAFGFIGACLLLRASGRGVKEAIETYA
ncbi:MFS transporter [Pandoraea bronchicola]|uniref:D-galactonate transporter n=1 Tax=Pandoraea bronchicola TaxID=2508287 RepID=A0A5E5BME4_9BURK|nr:MFS transporter [Pandoraea bronchicola]VVE86864.1 D-galactonate transporter [Pandoraea bronchicola]